MNYCVTIHLISDLCSSNGSTNGRMIDTDICFDSEGMPYIPAKRIKGVLLQAYLDYIDMTGEEDCSEMIFGEEDGEKEMMYVSDAHLSKEDESESTYYRTQICIDENGTTKDGSLRTMMVVKRGVQFEFDLEIISSSITKKTLDNILSLVTHIGLNRNRGFGVVSMSSKENVSSTSPLSHVSLENEKEYRYDILCKAMNDLLLPEENREISGSVIPGSSLYGFFAYRYMTSKKLDDPMNDETFTEIFYKNGVRFSFGFISDEKGTSYHPLPSCVQKGKNTNPSKYKLTLEKEGIDDSQERIKFKSLDSKFGVIDLEKKSIELKEIDFRYNYHHQRDKDEIGRGLVKDSSFFQYKAILAGQYFKFSLEGKGKYLKELLRNLETIHVGKSRTAQYGTLKIMWENSKYIEITKDRHADKSARLFLACVETPILLNDMNLNDKVENIDLDKFQHTLNKQYSYLEIKDECYSFSKKLVSGFNMLWKKSKPSVYAIALGSYVLLENTNNENVPDILHIGKRCNEGFGQIRLIPIDEMNVQLLPIEKPRTGKKQKSYLDNSLEAKKQAIEDLRNNPELYDFDHGLLSRMLLMLRQINNYNDFKNNIDCITDAKKKKNAQDILNKFNDVSNIKKDIVYYKLYFFTLLTLIKYKQRKDENSTMKEE